MEPEKRVGVSGTGRKSVWIGWGLSALIGALFVASGIGKLIGGQSLEEGMSHLGLPMSMVVPLAILELACIAVYLIPQTAVVGAILLTGYLGGAICTHWRVGDWFVLHIVIGVVIWLSVCLREPRLWAVIPWRR